MTRLLPAALAILCSLPTARAAPPVSAPPVSADAPGLVRWLIEHAGGRGFDGTDDRANAAVFSPSLRTGLRTALRQSLVRGRQQGQPPCGANGGVVLDMQEYGPIQGLRLMTEKTESDRATVRATSEAVGYHRDLTFMAVRLNDAWMAENIVTADGHSLRRSLACR